MYYSDMLIIPFSAPFMPLFFEKKAKHETAKNPKPN